MIILKRHTPQDGLFRAQPRKPLCLPARGALALQDGARLRGGVGWEGGRGPLLSRARAPGTGGGRGGLALCGSRGLERPLVPSVWKLASPSAPGLVPGMNAPYVTELPWDERHRVSLASTEPPFGQPSPAALTLPAPLSAHVPAHARTHTLVLAVFKNTSKVCRKN